MHRPIELAGPVDRPEVVAGLVRRGVEVATRQDLVRQFVRPWLWFTVWAAVGLYDGRYQPMVASAVLTVGMALCYLVGGGIAAFRQRP